MKAKKLLFIFLILLVLPTVYANDTGNIELSTISTDEFTIKPVLGDLVPSVLEPDTATDVNIAAPVFDTDGIKNASLYWTYNDIDSNTEFNTAMTESLNVEVLNEINLNLGNLSNYTSFGEVSDDFTNFMYGETTIENVMSDITFQIGANTAKGNIIIYYKVEYKNITTGNWELYDEKGVLCCQEINVNPPLITFNNVAGIKVAAVSYDTIINDVRAPRFASIVLSQDQYIGTIPASTDATFVNYYVKTFDNTDNFTVSPTYEILMDDIPTITFNEVLPAVIGGTQTLDLNITVSDDNNITSVGSTDVVAYYKLQNSNIWRSTTMTLYNRTTQFDAVYTASINIGVLGDSDPIMDIMINATDNIGSRNGRTGFVTDTVLVDNVGPSLVSLTFDTRSPVVNSTKADVITRLDVTISDDSGVNSASVFYKKLNDTSFAQLPLINTSGNLGEGQSPIDFYVLLPAIDETSVIEYYFRAVDFLGNTITTSTNYYYVDGDGPSIILPTLYPDHISNITDVSVLFNSTDISDIASSSVYYSYDNGTVWDSSNAASINYGASEVVNGLYDADPDYYNLPIDINNSRIDYLSMRVNETANIKYQRVVLKVTVTHDSATDLRIWLLVDGKEYLVFDRIDSSGQITINIDLLPLGISRSVFEDSWFTLKIQDYSDDYYGTIDAFQIIFYDYDLPYGYQFEAVIPKALNDTTVLYYIETVDLFGNIATTPVSNYYADGIAPDINHQAITDIQTEGANFIYVEATLYDKGGIQFAEAYYKNNANDTWNVISMILNEFGNYYANLPITNVNGNFSYYIRVIDMVNYQNTTEVYSFSFKDALGPLIVYMDTFEDVVDMDKENKIRINAMITDNTAVVNATIVYSIDGSKPKVKEMVDNGDGEYYFDITVLKSSGNISLSIIAVDDTGIKTQSKTLVISFINASNLYLNYGLGTTALIATTVGSFFGVKYLIKRRKDRAFFSKS